jgi:glycosyltransferase involved in cell wall biosynthesis
MFKIAVVGGYAEQYVDRCLGSILVQDRLDWDCQVVLDPVGDRSLAVARPYERSNLKIRMNAKRQFNVRNFLDAFALLNPADDDILVQIDADDWLATGQVFSLVKSRYDAEPRLLLTHGSWVSFPKPNVVSNNGAYSAAEFDRGVRMAPFRASHLRTMKHRLWKSIDDADLRDDRGDYASIAGDVAMMFPALEMAGFDRVRFIRDILYVYNQETPHNDGKQRRAEQERMAAFFRSKKPYPVRGDW